MTGAVIPHLTKTWGSSDRYLGVGDVDGDGYDDVCWYVSAGSVSTILSGATGSTLLTMPATLTQGGCDFDGDGLSDLLLIGFGPSSNDTWVRSSRTGAALFSHVQPHGFAFYSLVSMGDENGDGFDDVGLMRMDGLWPDETWLASVIRGPAATVVTLNQNAGAPCGDVNGDGATDIAVSVSLSFGGTARIRSGGSHATLWSLPSNFELAGVGDMDGDGHGDIAVDGAVHSGATQAPLAGAPPGGIARPLGDIDGDGRAECVVNLVSYQWVEPALPISSRMLRRGTSGTTSSGRKPTIVTRGHCGLGNTVWFDLRGNEPDSLVAFAVGDAVDVDLAPIGAPGNRGYTTLLGVQALLADPFGLASLTVVMPTSTSLLGSGVSVQSATFDAAANPLGIVFSNAIDIETRN